MRHCAELVFVRPRFDVDRSIAHQINEIFANCTSLIEPLSLYEAYLDVTQDLHGCRCWTALRCA
jgi:DNA polymerase IV